MSGNFIDVLHAVMTNQLIILAVAILLFLLLITLADPGQSQAVMGSFWV